MRHTTDPIYRLRGRCRLAVSLNGDIVHKELVFIECPPKAVHTPVHVLQEIDAPACLKRVKEGILFIHGNDKKRCIMRIDGANQFSNTRLSPSSLRAPKKYKEWFPVEIAFSDESNIIYVTDSYYNMVHMFSATRGKYIRSTGGRSHVPGKFNGPNGLCIVRDSVYICDSENHRIQVFDRHLQLV